MLDNCWGQGICLLLQIDRHVLMRTVLLYRVSEMNRKGTCMLFVTLEIFLHFFRSLSLVHLLFELYHTTDVYLLMSYAITDDDDDDDSIEWFALSSINLFMHKCFSSSCCPSCCQNLSERRHMNCTFWGFNKMTATIFILFVPYIMWNLFCLACKSWFTNNFCWSNLLNIN